MMYFLDTNICAFILNGTHPDLNKRYVDMDKRVIKLPSIVIFELLYGIEKSQRREENMDRFKKFAIGTEVISFDTKAAEIAGKLRADLEKIGQPIGGYDLMIAATALANDGIVITNNTREFSRINGLSTEDWSIPE